MRVKFGDVRPIDETFYHGRTRAGYPNYRVPAQRQVYWHAQINHYAVRTPDLYSRKKARGRGAWNADAEERHNDNVEDADPNEENCYDCGWLLSIGKK